MIYFTYLFLEFRTTISKHIDLLDFAINRFEAVREDKSSLIRNAIGESSVSPMAFNSCRTILY